MRVLVCDSIADACGCVYPCVCMTYIPPTHTHIYIWGQKQLKDKRNYFSVLSQVIAHHRGKSRQDRYSRQELRQRLPKNAGYSFVLFWLKFCQLSYKTQEDLLSGGTTHRGLSPPTSSAIKTTPHRCGYKPTCLSNPSTETPCSQVTLGCIKLIIKN